MKKQDSIYCILKIKQETIPWNWNQGNSALRNQRQEELNRAYKDSYFRILNAVVDSGGVFCMDKNTLDNDYRIYQNTVRIKIPKDAVEKIKSMPQLEYLTIDSRTA